MGWPFCDRCGSILEMPAELHNHITCTFCKLKCDLSEVTTASTVSRSAPRLQATWARDKNDLATGEEDNQHATIDEPCPKCGHPEQWFYTMQIRSVDEGSTVFYECKNPDCKHKYNLNN